MIGTNCYLVINEETKDTVMVDPGAYPAKLKNAVKEQGLKLKAILLTHAHFDHIMGLSDVMEDIKVPVYVEEADLPMMMDGESNLSSGYMRGGYQFADAVPVRDGQQLQIAGFQFRVIHTPGHTPGGCCYYIVPYIRRTFGLPRWKCISNGPFCKRKAFDITGRDACISGAYGRDDDWL